MQEYLKANYHTHTMRCKHAWGTEREYIEEAIRMGIKKLGFADHIPCPFMDGYVSNIRMSMSEAADYVKELRALADEYRNQIEIFVGFESEYIPEFYEEQLKMCHELGVDYLIMGQHFWKSESEGPYSGTPTQDDLRIRNYVDSIIEGMKTGKYTYLCHPDLMNYQGLDSVYEWEMTRLCKALKEMNIPLEINMGGMREKKHYPCAKFWNIAGEVGNEVIIGIDAHDIDFIRDVDTYEECLLLVKECKLNLIQDVELRHP